jgi:hypothetical protein
VVCLRQSVFSGRFDRKASETDDVCTQWDLAQKNKGRPWPMQRFPWRYCSSSEGMPIKRGHLVAHKRGSMRLSNGWDQRPSTWVLYVAGRGLIQYNSQGCASSGLLHDWKSGKDSWPVSSPHPCHCASQAQLQKADLLIFSADPHLMHRLGRNCCCSDLPTGNVSMIAAMQGAVHSTLSKGSKTDLAEVRRFR